MTMIGLLFALALAQTDPVAAAAARTGRADRGR